MSPIPRAGWAWPRAGRAGGVLALSAVLAAACAVEVEVAVDAGTGADPDAAPVAVGSTRYPATAVRAPVTAAVAARLRAIAAAGPAQRGDVFIKVGDSHTASPSLLTCFAAAAPYVVDLQGRDALRPTLTHFLAADIGAASSFERISLAAEVSRTARWAITGAPSPLAQELAAARPRFAFVNYGTNDMEQGTTHASALPGFVEATGALLDQLEAAGVVPILVGLTPRTDYPTAARWTPTYDAVTRALAEARQVPYVSLLRALADAPGQGLVSDGVHGNVYVTGGRAQPCVFTATGLGFTYNQRNLRYLEALTAAWTGLTGAAAAEPEALPPLAGTGTATAPFVIDQLPFTHTFDTRAGTRGRASYPGCGAQDQSGPEVGYRLALTAATPVRVIVLDGDGVDVDAHVLTGDACVERADRLLDRTLAAGDHDVVVDTYAGGGLERAGAYTLIVLACEPGDPDC